MHLTNTAINVENKGVAADVFTKLSSEVMEWICKRDRRGNDLQEKINEACRATIIGILPKMLTFFTEEADCSFTCTAE